jgi:hypothetical protein
MGESFVSWILRLGTEPKPLATWDVLAAPILFSEWCLEFSGQAR